MGKKSPHMSHIDQPHVKATGEITCNVANLVYQHRQIPQKPVAHQFQTFQRTHVQTTNFRRGRSLEPLPYCNGTQMSYDGHFKQVDYSS